MLKPILTLLTAFLSAIPFFAENDNHENPLPPVMGWSSWNTYHVNVSDDLIKSQADAMVRLGLKDAGYTHINIDDGFFGGRDQKTGKLLTHPLRFPNGLKTVADYIHSLGLKAGIYSDGGRNTCGNYYDNDTIAVGVGFYGHDRQDADFFFKECGFDFIKIDFCGGDPKGNHERLDLDERERYTAIRKAIDNTGREDARINVCRWDYPGTWVGEIGDSWRISQDIRPRWSSVKDIIGQSLYLSAYAGSGHYNDMDMLEVGRGMTEDEDRTHFGIWCIMSSPLLIGCDLNTIDTGTLSLLKNDELIALNQDPLCLQAYVAKNDSGVYLLVKDIEHKYGNTRAVAVYNSTDFPRKFTLDFSDVDLAGKVKVRDLFAQADKGVYSHSMTVSVPPHATEIFRLDAERRLDRTLYEAETAFLQRYQEIDNNVAVVSPIYISDDSCSGNMGVAYLGKHSDNDLLWRDVNVSEAGKYECEIVIGGELTAPFIVNVNGKDVKSVRSVDDLSFTISLNKGNNSVRLYTKEHKWMPMIDCMRVGNGIPDNLSLTNLTVEGRYNPFGLDVEAPRFGWQIKSGKKNVMQTSYRILIASDSAGLKIGKADVWDSGKVNSDSSQWIEYKGIPLIPGKQYFWKAIVTTNKDTQPAEATGEWVTGLLSPDNWEGEWIGLDTLALGEILDRHCILAPRYMRKEFNVGKQLKRATLHISGVGNYFAIVNGKRVGDDVLTPLPTDYSKTVAYDSYDITSLITDKNAIGVAVAGGNFTGMVQNFQTNVRTSYGLPRMIANIILEYADGSRETIATDGTWKLSTDGPIRNASGYDGETYDSNFKLGEWTKSGYDDKKWRFAKKMEAPSGRLLGALAPNMHIYQSEYPVSLRKEGDKYLVDFGTNGAGRVKIKIDAAKGDTIRIRHAELLNKSGKGLYTDNLRGAKATATFISDGTPQEFCPEFTYYGFRYAEIEGIDNLEVADISRELIADRMNDENSSITIYDKSGNDILNKIIANARRGVQSNYKGMPIDCPQRDERMPWLGDRTTGCFGESYLMDNRALYAKWAADICDSQRDNGMISDVSPAYWRLYNGNVTWSAALPFVCDMIYRQYGDVCPMRNSYPNIKKFLHYLKENKYDEGIITFDKYGDWCVPPESPELVHSNDPARKTDGQLLSTAYYIYLCRLMEKYSRLVFSNEDDARYFANEAGNSEKAFNQQFLSGGNYSNGTVTANLLPLAIGIVPQDKSVQVADSLLYTIINVNNSHISTGVIGIQWLMRYLSDSGQGNLAYELASKGDYPGWGYMVNKGATTIWELWNGDTANPSMNSCNHVMLLGDLLLWCYEYLGGIRPDSQNPGFKHIIFKPDYSIEALSGVEVSHPSPYGVISARWKKREGKYEISVSVPHNTTAEIYLPSGEKKTVGSGSHSF